MLHATCGMTEQHQRASLARLQLGESCDFALDATKLVRAGQSKPSLLKRIIEIGEGKFGRAQFSVFRLSTPNPLGRLRAVQV